MNSSEMFAREKKAAKLAEVLYLLDGVTPAMVLSATEDDWENIAQRAGCKPPNPKNPKPTVDAVLVALERMNLDGGPEPKTAQQEADEAAAADNKTEAKWEESQEYAGNRCPPRE